MDRKQVELEKELVSEIRKLLTDPLERRIEELEKRIDRALDCLPKKLVNLNNANDWEEVARYLFHCVSNARGALLGTEGE